MKAVTHLRHDIGDDEVAADSVVLIRGAKPLLSHTLVVFEHATGFDASRASGTKMVATITCGLLPPS